MSNIESAATCRPADGPGIARAEHAEPSLQDLSLLDLAEVLGVAGIKTSTLYGWMDKGLWPRQVKVSSRCVRWPAGEVRQVTRARISGASDAQIADLVTRLHSQRSNPDA